MKTLKPLLIMLFMAALFSCDQKSDEFSQLSIPGILSGSYVAGNPHCGDLTTGCTLPFTSGDLEPASTGTVGPITWNYNSSTGLVTWTSTSPVKVAFIIKGGPGANVYVECSEFKSAGSLPMTTPLNPKNNKFYDLSHLEICYDIEVDPIIVAVKSLLPAYGSPTSEATWASSEGEELFTGSTCMHLGINPLPGTTSFNMLEESTQLSVGSVDITTVNTNLVINFNLNGTLYSSGTYIYIGPKSGLVAASDGCPNYLAAPWVSMDRVVIEGMETNDFSISVPVPY